MSETEEYLISQCKQCVCMPDNACMYTQLTHSPQSAHMTHKVMTFGSSGVLQASAGSLTLDQLGHHRKSHTEREREIGLGLVPFGPSTAKSITLVLCAGTE